MGITSPAEMGGIEVSPEMLTLLGRGVVGDRPWPATAVAFEFDEAVSFTFRARPSCPLLNRNSHTDRLIFIVALSACERLFGGKLQFIDGETYLLPAELRSIAIAIRDCAMPEAAAAPYRLAKSIELVCEIINASRKGPLLMVGGSSLSFADRRRVAAARQLIDEHWQEALTLAQIARRCGLNRSKLSRGFRELYRCTVNEALCERRLAEARRQLISTDLPIGLIGYQSGYQNNASFSRAFCRRFGIPPSDFRTRAVAA